MTLQLGAAVSVRKQAGPGGQRAEREREEGKRGHAWLGFGPSWASERSGPRLKLGCCAGKQSKPD